MADSHGTRWHSPHLPPPHTPHATADLFILFSHTPHTHSLDILGIYSSLRAAGIDGRSSVCWYWALTLSFYSSKACCRATTRHWAWAGTACVCLWLLDTCLGIGAFLPACMPPLPYTTPAYPLGLPLPRLLQVPTLPACLPPPATTCPLPTPPPIPFPTHLPALRAVAITPLPSAIYVVANAPLMTFYWLLSVSSIFTDRRRSLAVYYGVASRYYLLSMRFAPLIMYERLHLSYRGVRVKHNNAILCRHTCWHLPFARIVAPSLWRKIERGRLPSLTSVLSPFRVTP